MEDLETKLGDSGFFDWFWKRKWLRKTILPFATAASVFYGDRKAEAQQSVTLNHDPVLLIHGLDTDFKDTNDEYSDFNGNRVVNFEDFLLFSQKFGAKRNDVKYDEGFDIDRNGEIGFGDFLIFSENFGKITRPLESTWDELSKALINDLRWRNGGTVGSRVSNNNLTVSDFYELRLSSGNRLTFDQQGEEVKLAVDKINKITERNVILVGFSMGGLSARAYLQNYTNPPDPKASALITICTPHAGSYLAYLSEGVDAKSKISDWKERFKDKLWTEKTAELFLAYIGVASKDKPVIKHLAPCSDSLRILNNNIYKMPTGLQYINVVSEVPNQEVLDSELELINKYLLNYEICKQAASPELLAKGDGVVPTISQLLSYAIVNTNPENASWYEKARGNITENSEMQVPHMDANKQVDILERVLSDLISILETNIREPGLESTTIITPAGTMHEMVLVPSGEFTMGYSEGEPNERLVHIISLDRYLIDKYEVTNAHYLAFLNIVGRNKDVNGYEFLSFGWAGSNSRVVDSGGGRFELKSPSYATHPVQYVSWYGARAYCEWMGSRLPTEAEWEKAARGTDERIYPWGNELTGQRANFFSSGDPFFKDGTTPVGYYDGSNHDGYQTLDGSSPYGVHDIVGNVGEWCNDWFSGDYYDISPRENPQGPSEGGMRVRRGSSYGTIYYLGRVPEFNRLTDRNSHSPSYGVSSNGFRCARTPQQ